MAKGKENKGGEGSPESKSTPDKKLSANEKTAKEREAVISGALGDFSIFLQQQGLGSGSHTKKARPHSSEPNQRTR